MRISLSYFSIPKIKLGDNDPRFNPPLVPLITVTRQPSALNVIEGNTATFIAAGSSSPVRTIVYQWERRNGDPGSFNIVNGATSSAYSLVQAQLTDNNSFFRCGLSASNALQVYTNAVLLSVLPPPITRITVTRAPSSINVREGSTATFTVVASTLPTKNLTYQWRSTNALSASFTNIVGATLSSYSISEVNSDLNRSYYQCALSASNSDLIFSSNALLSVVPFIPVNQLGNIGWYVRR